ncbi:MAG: CpsD/CapB family tyrosine-protein kinase [Bryobacteraceae bacterium]
MSRIFDALKKAQGEVAEVGLPLIERAGSPPPSMQAAGTPLEAPSIAVEDLQRETAHRSANTDLRVVTIRSVAIRPPTPGVVLPFSGDSRAGEQYRMIRNKIVQHPRKPRLFMVSSPGAGDGKTLSAINIAGVLGLRENVKVLLIDADFRRPNLAQTLGLASEPGLANVLSGDCDLSEAVCEVEQLPNLCVLPAGTGTRNPAELLDSDGWRELCAEARREFGFVVIDAPPIATVADYELIQSVCDGVIMIVRPDHTDRTICTQALKQVPKEKMLGAVINCAEDWFLWKTQGSYYYGRQQSAK